MAASCPCPRDTGHTGVVEKEFQAQTEASAEALFTVVSDLTTFPDWIDLVHRVEPITATNGSSTEHPEWWVTLRAQLGPLARSKRLRMARTVHVRPDPAGGGPGRVRFDRSETDGRNHAAWTMEVTVHPIDGGTLRSRADCRLHYGGSLWTGLLDGQLDTTADRSADALRALVNSQSAG